MINEIRKIKLQPILEQLQEDDEIRSKIKNNEEEIEREYKKDKLSSKAEKLKVENSKLQDKLNKLEELKKEKSRIENASLSDFGMDFQEAIEFLQDHNVEIVLTEEDKEAIYSKENQKNEEIKSFEDLILVHKTDYPPKNSQIKPSSESNVKNTGEVQIRGKQHKFEYNMPRNTVHFYMNGEVGSHNSGYWDDMKYVVLIPLDKVNKEKMIGGSMVDTYFDGIVDIPNDSYLLCPKGEKHKVQADNPNITILEYEGERALEYGDALVSALGYYNEGRCVHGWMINKKGEEQALNLYKEKGFRIGAHAGSKERKQEQKKAKINRTLEACEVIKKNLKEINGKDELYGISFLNTEINIEELDELFQRLEEKNVNISPKDRQVIRGGYEGNKEIIKEDSLEAEEMRKYIKFENKKKYELARDVLNYMILKELGKERILEIQKEKEERVLAKKMKNFEFNIEDMSYKNATEEEGKIEKELIENQKNKINRKLKEKGIDKYLFEILGEEVIVADPNFEKIEDIDKALQGKPHYRGIGIMGGPTVDFEEKEDETVGEYLERLEKYTDCFSKYYDGETIDESIKFDENGNLIEEPKIERPDYEKTAKTKEAAIEIHSGKNVQEIKDEMNPNKTKEEVETEYGE